MPQWGYVAWAFVAWGFVGTPTASKLGVVLLTIAELNECISSTLVASAIYS